MWRGGYSGLWRCWGGKTVKFSCLKNFSLSVRILKIMELHHTIHRGIGTTPHIEESHIEFTCGWKMLSSWTSIGGLRVRGIQPFHPPQPPLHSLTPWFLLRFLLSNHFLLTLDLKAFNNFLYLKWIVCIYPQMAFLDVKSAKTQ